MKSTLQSYNVKSLNRNKTFYNSHLKCLSQFILSKALGFGSKFVPGSSYAYVLLRVILVRTLFIISTDNYIILEDNHRDSSHSTTSC